MWMRDIPLERDAGGVRCASAKVWGTSTLSQVLLQLGFPNRPEALKEVGREKAQEILVAILSRDLAYRAEAMPRNRAEQLALEFIESQGDAKFYSNGDWSAYVFGGGSTFSWSELTDATFDAGVISVSQELACSVWVEDED
jgi:hypothetical protein